MNESIAHIRQEDRSTQSVKNHLIQVSIIASQNASKIGLSKAGELLGLLHDLGKYSQVFQNYIGSSSGIINHDADEYVDSELLKGKIDHSTAGAKFIWDRCLNEGAHNQIFAQLLSLCLSSHHSGLIDCINVDGENIFSRRMAKKEEQCHLHEAQHIADNEIVERATLLITDTECINSVIELLKQISINNKSDLTRSMQSGLLVRMLFSCLIDADRLDTANFEAPQNILARQNGHYICWSNLIERLEKKLHSLNNKGKNPIDKIRKQISDACYNRASDHTGVFTLTVPTGGGKTLSSLRFALHHAKKHNLDHIIYVIPYTSIIDQNANVVREILEQNKDEKGRIVLEHHSNLLSEKKTWKTKLLTENWDSPIIFTTSVQFLETLFNGGTNSARRMHQLSRSVIVFDEIQTLPLKTTHLFCNAINFLTKHCKSSVVLCTATQPLLNKVSENKGSIDFSHKNEIIPDVTNLFCDLKRVEVINKTKPQGWGIQEITQLAIEQVDISNNCLIIVNTKSKAREIYNSCILESNIPIIHLSTSMCPAHRINKLNVIRNKLESNETFICVSTQLIEAGVDLDFGSVIRFVGGIDSIAQAAGRCNRNGKRNIGKVFIVNPKDERIETLQDIKIGRDISNRILCEIDNPESDLPADLIHPSVMERYFQYYFYNRAEEMSYSVDVGRNDNLLNLLSTNSFSVKEYKRIYDQNPKLYFKQAFSTAGEHFQAIDAPTHGIIVPYTDSGEKIITDFFSQFAIEQQNKLIRKSQKYTVNLFPSDIKKLNAQKALREVPEIGVLVLTDPRFYHPEFGLSTEVETEYETLITN